LDACRAARRWLRDSSGASAVVCSMGSMGCDGNEAMNSSRFSSSLKKASVMALDGEMKAGGELWLDLASTYCELLSWSGESGVAKRPRERSPTRNPQRFATISSLYRGGQPTWEVIVAAGLCARGGVRSSWSAAASSTRVFVLVSGTFIHSPSTSVRKCLHASLACVSSSLLCFTLGRTHAGHPCLHVHSFTRVSALRRSSSRLRRGEWAGSGCVTSQARAGRMHSAVFTRAALDS
jgi:hypothetical protein